MHLDLDSLRFNRRTEERIVRFGWAMAWFGLLLGPLHAMARHATAEGARDFDTAPLTKAWSVPTSEALAPLLTWSDPYTVYTMYGRLWVPVYASIGMSALLVRTKRAMPGRGERWAWRVLLTAYVVMTLSIVGDYFTPWMDQSFLFLGMPAAAMTLVGATWLGVALLRAGFRPRVLPWVIALWLPSVLAITQVTSLGSVALPSAFAWAYAGSRLLAREAEDVADRVPSRAVRSDGRQPGDPVRGGAR